MRTAILTAFTLALSLAVTGGTTSFAEPSAPPDELTYTPPPELVAAIEKRFPGLKLERTDFIICDRRGNCGIRFDIGNQTEYRIMICHFRRPAKLGRCGSVHA
jgi:hypothetical protein